MQIRVVVFWSIKSHGWAGVFKVLVLQIRGYFFASSCAWITWCFISPASFCQVGRESSAIIKQIAWNVTSLFVVLVRIYVAIWPAAGQGFKWTKSTAVRVKVVSHPKCDHFVEKIFYDSNIDLTPIFVLKRNFEKILFLREVMDKILFSSLIAVNDWLKSYCNNLSTHHNYLTLPNLILCGPGYESVYCGINNTRPIIFRKSTQSFTKSSSFVLIGPISNKIQPFKNFKIY